jgi:hypothetical protein
MVPNNVCCDDCGQQARVRAYGRIEYDWPKTPTDGPVATMPTISCIRLTIDCPICGVKTQDFRPTNSDTLPADTKPPRQTPPSFTRRFRKPK